MARRLPPLNSLRVFEAAARHLSFTKAAQELFVTQGAVSQQIKALEAELGVQLFKRLNRRLLLSDAGQTLAAGVGEALEVMSRAVARARQQELAGVLTVTTMQSFAGKWLVPRLARFQARWPQIDLRLHTSIEVVDLRASDIDMAIRHGRGVYPGLDAELLVAEQVFPVCSPALLPRLRTPADLADHLLIQDQGVDWRPWLQAAGVPWLDGTRGPGFSDSHLALEAAIAGQGVALGRTVVAAADLAAGRLVRPFDISVPSPDTYWVVSLPDQTERPRVKAFRDWLFEEMAKDCAPTTPGARSARTEAAPSAAPAECP